MPKHQLCRNCGHTVDANYCPSCGQRTSTHRLGWASLTESVASTFIGDEAYGLRGIGMRKGAVMTWLDILFRPHRVIPEFIAGRRRKYFNPVAILLLLSTFYAVVFTLAGKVHVPRAAEGQNPLLWAVNTYIDYATLHPAGYLLLLLPFLALAMKSVFRKKADLRYVEYLYIGIFLGVFDITLMILALPAEVLIPWYSSFYMSTLPSFLYTAFVLWKVFGLKRKRSALLRTLLTELLQYVYLILTTVLLFTALIGGYYLLYPEKCRATFSAAPEAPTGQAAGEAAAGEAAAGEAAAGEDAAGEEDFLRDFLLGVGEALSGEDDEDESLAVPRTDSLPAK